MKLSRTKRKELIQIKENKKLQLKMEKIANFVDLSSPQWFICKTCKYFSKDAQYGICALGCKNPGGFGGAGARKWLVDKEEPKVLFNCHKVIYHIYFNKMKRQDQNETV